MIIIQGIMLFSPNAGNATTLWSEILNQRTDVNSIESSFRIAMNNQNKSNNHVGLRWIEGDVQYFTKLSKNGLELYQRPEGSKYSIILSRNTEITEANFWYTLRIESVNNLIKIFVNNIPKIQVSKSLTDNKNEGISKIGLVSLHNTVEFKPLKIWNIPSQPYESNESVKYYNYYSPLICSPCLKQINYLLSQL